MKQTVLRPLDAALAAVAAATEAELAQEESAEAARRRNAQLVKAMPLMEFVRLKMSLPSAND